MFTRCPQCRTVFRVSAAMLKAAQGRVRCGRCSHVFNALAFLLENPAAADDIPPDAPASAGARSPSAPVAAPEAMTPAPPARPAKESAAPSQAERYDDNHGVDDEFETQAGEPPAAAPPVPEEDEPGEIVDEQVEDVVMEDPDALAADDAEEIVLDSTGAPEAELEVDEAALEFNADVNSVFIEEKAPTLPPLPLAAIETAEGETAEHEVLDIDLDETGSREAITLEGDSVVILEEEPAAPVTPEVELTAAERAAALDETTQRDVEAAFAADPATRAEFVLPSGRRIALGGPGDDPDATQEVEAHEQLALDTRRQRRRQLAWTAASVLFGLLLAVQIVHRNRQALAETSTLGPIVQSLYGSFGREVTPAWDLHAYEVRQSGAATDPEANGTLRVRASLMNGAPHPQPFPLLRLTLQDRFGERIGLRDLEPDDYLSSPPRRGELLGAGQRIDAEIRVVDPGKDAVGFEIDVCLRRDSAITCANDAPRQAG